MRVTATTPAAEVPLAAERADRSPRRTERPAVLAGEGLEIEVVSAVPDPGTAISGPAVIELPESTLLIPRGWSGEVMDSGTIRLERTLTIDPVELQVLSGALRAICEEMGAVLIRAAHSANIKERRDASTALFDPHGEMVMQAEHIPVHLGAMPAAVRAILDEEHAPGALVDPQRPLPRRHPPPRHHGDHPGVRRRRADRVRRQPRPSRRRRWPDPGSMPADSRTLADEGVVIEPQVLDDAAIDRLAGADAPARRSVAPTCGRSSRPASVGVRRLQELHDRVGGDTLREAFAAVLDYAERRTRACIEELDDGTCTAEDVLEAREGDLRIALRATIAGDTLTLDFDGTDAQHEGNLNCPLAVTRSACYFAVRVLTDPDIPPSAGAYRPIEVSRPEGSLLNARSPAAVVGGNVETSSRIADVVLRAFGHALGQGTMNNVTFGTEDVVYYETIGGGQGACADADGPSGVHVAMSNTLNTPVEALELEFPLRMVRYALRRGSGGAGAHRGGDGVIREFEALAPLHYSLITERRRHAPPGADGGEPGAPGRNLLDGEELPPKAIGELDAGRGLRIETPGGGGRGKSPSSES